MSQDMKKLPTGIADYRRIRERNYYYVDKTGFLRSLEDAGSFLFLVRPRRFGKSLFLSMLSCYYDIADEALVRRLLLRPRKSRH